MDLWEKCVEFHGHSCGGLAIGYRAAVYARKLLEAERCDDEQVVCVSENDACGIDAVQVVLGCTVGKGNLLFHITGKQAFSFYHRGSGRSFRLVQKPKPQGLGKEESFRYYLSCGDEELFEVKPVRIELPETARIFDSYICDQCGEKTSANMIRLGEGGKKLCIDCFPEYRRFDL